MSDIYKEFTGDKAIIKDDKTFLEVCKKYYSNVLGISTYNVLNMDLYQYFTFQGFHISIHPEFYLDGINWNFQVFWYNPEKGGALTLGSFMYGDNNEYPTRRKCELAAFSMCFYLMTLGINPRIT